MNKWKNKEMNEKKRIMIMNEYINKNKNNDNNICKLSNRIKAK